MNTIRKITSSAIILFACFGVNILAFPAARPVSGSSSDHFVTVDNLKVHYIESGAGPTVVLIHGNAGGVEDFEFGAIDSLARKYRVVAIDRPGHGASDRAAGSSSPVEYQAQLLHQTLSVLGIKKPILVGHSWGGSLVLSYALKYPDEVAAMVLLAPAAYPEKGGSFLLSAAAKIPGVAELGGLLEKSIISPGLLKRDLDRAFSPQPVPDRYFNTFKQAERVQAESDARAIDGLPMIVGASTWLAPARTSVGSACSSMARATIVPATIAAANISRR